MGLLAASPPAGSPPPGATIGAYLARPWRARACGKREDARRADFHRLAYRSPDALRRRTDLLSRGLNGGGGGGGGGAHLQLQNLGGKEGERGQSACLGRGHT